MGVPEGYHGGYHGGDRNGSPKRDPPGIQGGTRTFTPKTIHGNPGRIGPTRVDSFPNAAMLLLIHYGEHDVAYIRLPYSILGSFFYSDLGTLRDALSILVSPDQRLTRWRWSRLFGDPETDVLEFIWGIPYGI